MGGFRNFAISFTIISILAGCLTSYTIAFEHGGPVAVTWGWLLVGLMSTLIALSHGRDRVGVPDRGRPLLLVVEARGPWLGLGDGLVQPHRPDRGHGGDRLRPRGLRAGALRLLVQLLGAHGRLVRCVVQHVDVHPLRGVPARCGDHQHVQHPDHVGAEHDLRLVAHGRRRACRRHPHHRSRSASVALVRLHGDGEQLGLRGWNDLVLQSGVLVRARTRASDVPVHDHRASTRRRTRPRRRSNASRMAATGMWTSVFVSVVFGWILLLAVTFADSGHAGRRSTPPTSSFRSCRSSGPSR